MLLQSFLTTTQVRVTVLFTLLQSLSFICKGRKRQKVDLNLFEGTQEEEVSYLGEIGHVCTLPQEFVFIGQGMEGSQVSLGLCNLFLVGSPQLAQIDRFLHSEQGW